MERKATPEISCHSQARWGVSPPAIAWKNQVWDLINLPWAHRQRVHPQCGKSWLWSFTEKVQAGLVGFGGRGKWWGTSEPLVLIGTFRLSWGVVSMEDNGSTAKTGTAPQENPGRCKKYGKKEFSSGNGIWCVIWLCWGITSDEPSAPKLQKMLPQGALGYCLDFSPLWGADVSGCSL